MKTRIGFIGAGWRARGYMRVVEEFRRRMEVSGVLVHSSQRAEQMEQEFPGKIDQDLDKFMARGHDFVVVLVPKEAVLDYITALMKQGIPVLSETPPGNGVAELNECYELKQTYHGKIQVTEQCFLRPYYQAVLNLIQEGCLGRISNMGMGTLHDYHAMSIMRKTLGVGFENCTIDAREYYFPVQYHCGREGMHKEACDHLVKDHRKRADLVFESGKAGFYDFSDEQYFNYFRTRHMYVRGELGEIYDYDVAFLGEQKLPVLGRIARDELGQYENLEGCGLRGLTLHGRPVYQNPYWEEDVRLNDDEIAMAGMLDGMARYAAGGEEIYPLKEALQDTYLHLTLDESIRQGRPMTTTTQNWARQADRP
ncbi:MAG: Gfo/Idh/MocA family oxidoreductase [Lachnospiraceae bacterium]|jgi:hypothetical protein|nr:Gfo/Idh/MocA family oxidoreductase [Lachnospiraceae bacterium]